MYRWLTGVRDSSNGFGALPGPERDRLLAHSRVVLAEFNRNIDTKLDNDPEPNPVTVVATVQRVARSRQMRNS